MLWEKTLFYKQCNFKQKKKNYENFKIIVKCYLFYNSPHWHHVFTLLISPIFDDFPMYRYKSTSISRIISHHSPLLHINYLLIKPNYLEFSDYILLFHTFKIYAWFFNIIPSPYFILLTLIFSTCGLFFSQEFLDVPLAFDLIFCFLLRVL